MKKWFTKKYPPALSPPVAVTALQTGGRGAGWEGALPQPLRPPEAAVYEGLREAVPIVDAALQKIVRLTAGVQVTCSHPAGQRYLDRFIREVPVGAGGTGLETFLSGYLMSLLTYGNAVGEMVPGPEGDEIAALYLSDLGDVELRREESPLAARLLVRGADGLQPVPYPELVFFSALDPAPGEIQGRSLLRGLPFLSGVLMQIYQAVGQNFQRIGALRYAVTVKPEPGSDAQGVAQAATPARWRTPSPGSGPGPWRPPPGGRCGTSSPWGMCRSRSSGRTTSSSTPRCRCARYWSRSWPRPACPPSCWASAGAPPSG